MATPVERLIATAKAEIGYLEKKTNAQLDSKTANAGSNNWTKYAAFLDNLGNIYNGRKNGYAWCDMFVDWCFITTFGIDLGMQLLCQAYKGAGAGCTYSAQYYQRKGQFHTKNPQPGDQIFFTDDGGKSSYHTGLVVKVDNTYVYTIEGNTSSKAGVVANGGCVRDKSYKLTYSQIMGYGRPNWSLAAEKEETVTMKQDEFYKMFLVAYAQYMAELQDNDAGTYSQEARDWSVNSGLIAGNGSTVVNKQTGKKEPNYMWQAPITREQMVTVLKRAVDTGVLCGNGGDGRG